MKKNQRAVFCSETEPVMLEAFTRLAELLDTPEHIPYLAPLLIREIHYRLLTGPQGKHVRAIKWMRPILAMRWVMKALRSLIGSTSVCLEIRR